DPRAGGDLRGAARLSPDPALEPARGDHAQPRGHPRLGRPVRRADTASAGAAVTLLPTPISGVMQVELQPQVDERGSFARTYCEATCRAHGLEPVGVQCNISVNPRRGTLRGLHFQAPPAEEAKLVRCTRGRLFDVAVDLRRESPTFRRWFGV